MGKSQETFSKKEREKNRLKKRQEKEEKKAERKANSDKGKSFEEMLAYVDENGNISQVPSDPKKKKIIKAEDIVLNPSFQENPTDIIRTGVVTFFNVEKGYGFIKDSANQEGVFVHINNLTAPLKEKDKVSFEIENTPRGVQAISVKLLD